MTGLTDAEVRELFRGTRCLVTGGLGFIGSNVALALCEGGADVTIVDALVPRHGGNVNNIAGASPHFIVADMGDSAAVTEPLSRAQYVFNVAGQVSHVDSMQDPLADLEVNGRSQLAFLELVRRTNPEAVVVYTSTRQVYGRPRYLPVDETHPVDPVDVNGVAKYAAEQFHRIYHDVHRIRTVSLRITNVYGPRQRLTGDHQGFIPVCVRCALEGHPIRIYGDGDHERDCLYVSDVVAGLLRAAVCEESHGEVLNLGNDEHFQLQEIADLTVRLAGGGSMERVPWPRERERIAIGSCWTDSSKAKEMLGWQPTVTLEDGMRETLAYYREHLRWYV